MYWFRLLSVETGIYLLVSSRSWSQVFIFSDINKPILYQLIAPIINLLLPVTTSHSRESRGGFVIGYLFPPTPNTEQGFETQDDLFL
jgi:hypothetical protein